MHMCANRLDRQTDSQTDRQKERQTDRQKDGSDRWLAKSSQAQRVVKFRFRLGDKPVPGAQRFQHLPADPRDSVVQNVVKVVDIAREHQVFGVADHVHGSVVGAVFIKRSKLGRKRLEVETYLGCQIKGSFCRAMEDRFRLDDTGPRYPDTS